MSTKTAKSSRVRHVHKSDMVAHLWANQSQREAYTSSRNCSFDGPALKSYSTVIALHVTHGEKSAVLISTRNYSSTTCGHQSDARRASAHLTQIMVPQILTGWGQVASNPAPYVAAFRERIERIAPRVASAKSRPSKACRLNELDREIAAANGFCRFFDLPEFVATVEGHDADSLQVIRDYGTARDAKLRETYHERSAARQAAAQARWEAGNAQYRERMERERAFSALPIGERVRLWTIHDPIAPRTFHDSGKHYMRLSADGSEIETSNGATVPTSHVKRIAPLVLKMIRAGSIFKAGDAPGSVRIGHFSLNSIDENGTVRVGCHTFDRAEIERVNMMIEEFDRLVIESLPKFLGV